MDVPAVMGIGLGPSRSNTEPRLDLKDVLLGIRRHWIAIASATLVGMSSGVILALTLPPIYTSDATISMKQNQGDGGASQLFGRLGGLGGAVASQLTGASGSLDKVEIVLKSRALAERVVTRTDGMARILPGLWDAKKGAWKGGLAPSLVQAADQLRTGLLKTHLDAQKQILVLSIQSRDSGFTRKLAEAYLVELNEKLKGSVIEDADSNRSYLERNLAQTLDPMLREKIANIIANEMERALLVRTSVIEVLEAPETPLVPSKPNRRMIALTVTVLGFALGMCYAVYRSIWKGGDALA